MTATYKCSVCQQTEGGQIDPALPLDELECDRCGKSVHACEMAEFPDQVLCPTCANEAAKDD